MTEKHARQAEIIRQKNAQQKKLPGFISILEV